MAASLARVSQPFERGDRLVSDHLESAGVRILEDLHRKTDLSTTRSRVRQPRARDANIVAADFFLVPTQQTRPYFGITQGARSAGRQFEGGRSLSRRCWFCILRNRF